MQMSDMRKLPTLRMTHNKAVTAAVALVVVVGLAGLGAAAYLWFSGGSGQASTPVSASKLDVVPGQNGRLFQIVADESEVRFIIDEVLFGDPKAVVGRTDQVAGEILLDADHPSQAQIGVIRVNANTLKTDNEFRNRTLRGQILESTHPEYEFVEFTPKALERLPAQVTVGQPVTFQIRGDLQVRDVTHEVTFDAHVTLVNPDRLEGTAQAVVRRQDFRLTIPDVPGVANVSDTVHLEIDFVALPLS
jgi:polyisoprenoid-binding protein YceI